MENNKYSSVTYNGHDNIAKCIACFLPVELSMSHSQNSVNPTRLALKKVPTFLGCLVC